MANSAPNSFRSMLWKGQIAAETDTFKMILMETGFVFDKDAHHAYADVSAYELSTGNGYTAGGVTLTSALVTTNNTDDRSELTFDNVQIDASGGSLVTSGGIIYDDSTDTSGGDDYTDAIMSYKDAGGTITATDGTPVIFSSIREDIGS